jgi:hypothetical protein
MKTTPRAQAMILSDLYMEYKGDPEFLDFFEYNDLGLSLSYSTAHNIVETSPKAEMFIAETWELLMATLKMEDEGFESLEDVFIASGR